MTSQSQIHEEEALGKAYDARLMRRLLRYLIPYRWPVVAAVALLLLASVVELVGPWLTKIALDEAVPAGDGRLLGILAAVYVVSLLAALLLQYADELLTTWLGQRVMYDLRTQIFAHLQRLDLRYYDRTPVGRTLTRVTSDVEVLNELFSSGVVTVFGDVFTLVFIVGAMLIMDWKLALVTFAVLPFVALVAFLFRAKVREAYRDIRVRLARLNAFLNERFTGIRVVQLFNREAADARRFRELDRDYLNAHLRSIRYYALFFPAIELLTSVALALIIWYGGLSLLGGTLTLGVIAAFLQYARRFFRPIQDLSEKYNLLQGAMASSERIFKLLDTQPNIRDPDSPLHLPKEPRGEIEFRDVWFAYDGSGEGKEPVATAGPSGNGPAGAPTWVIRGLSFRVAPGERLAIVGHTGAGKTTLINLLMRFYDPQRGEILLDGVPIRRLPLAELRSRIGLVLQDVFLFSHDVAYNLRLGNQSIDAARMRNAAARVGAARFIDRLPRGYAQPLSERGSSLSVGERQLVSFARALTFAPLILVLDEATSSVDSEIEAQIQQAIEELLHGRTSLVIAHRLSTVQNADRIIVMHHGEIREEGSHEELLERGGIYARLHELQFERAPVG
ncbi:MAG: ABC transporter ATP-binding protein [Gemmatimonadetes bacterium]|nr:ABC transporter ATP-binding protein [Gemmatimonadota bacterium]